MLITYNEFNQVRLSVILCLICSQSHCFPKWPKIILQTKVKEKAIHLLSLISIFLFRSELDTIIKNQYAFSLTKFWPQLFWVNQAGHFFTLFKANYLAWASLHTYLTSSFLTSSFCLPSPYTTSIPSVICAFTILLKLVENSWKIVYLGPANQFLSHLHNFYDMFCTALYQF